MVEQTALEELLEFISINQADDGSLGDPFFIIISYQQQADKLRFIEELTEQSLKDDLQFKTYFPNTEQDHGIGKIIGHLVDDANNNRLSLVTSLATEPQGEIDHKFLSYINLHRDRIVHQNLHYVLFVQADQMEEFMISAPDLWSFREQVLYLERDETQTMPNVELSSQLMWQNIETDMQKSEQSPEVIQEATEKIAQTKALVAEINDDNDKTLLLTELAEWLTRRELYIQAFEVAEQILLNQSDIQPPLKTTIYYVCGYAQFRMYHYTEAIMYFEKALKVAQTFKLESSQPDIFQQLGDCYLRLNNHKAALKYYNSAFKKAQKTNDKAIQIRSLSRQAEIKGANNELDDSIAIYQQSLSIAQQSNNVDDEAWIKQNLGYIYESQQRYDLAYDYYDSTLSHFQTIGYLHGLAKSHIDIGRLLIRQQKIDNVKYHFTQALTISEKINDKNVMAQSYYYLALYHNLDDLKSATNYAKKSLNLFTQIDHINSNKAAQLLAKLENQAPTKT